MRYQALNPTHIISDTSKLNTTFVLMLLIIILSFIDWRCGWGVFCTCEYEDFTCTAMYAHFIALWLLIPHTSSQRAMKCVHIGVHAYYVKSSFSHVQNTPQPHRQSMKLRIMIGSIKTKVVFNFEVSEMMCVGLRAKEL